MATMNALNHADALEVNGIDVWIDGVVCAFGIGSRLTDTPGVLF